jgi:hypothetical protein
VVRAELELDEVLLPKRAARAKDIADRKEGDPRRGDAAVDLPFAPGRRPGRVL